MMIEESDFQIIPQKNSRCAFDLKFLDKEVFKIYAYGIPIKEIIQRIALNRIHTKYLENTLNTGQFLIEFRTELKKLDYIIDKYFIFKNNKFWLLPEYIN